MSNGITKENLLRTLPSVLYDDANMQALAEAVATELEALAQMPSQAMIYERIDELPETMCDILAYDFKVDWWRQDASITEKRRALKSSWYVHHHLGTRAAIERTVTDFLGAGKVEEWFEYDGQPHHFRISSENNSNIVDQYDTFLAVLNAVKRCSSVLDHITSMLICNQTIFIGMALGISKSGAVTTDTVNVTAYTLLVIDGNIPLTMPDGSVLVI